MSEEQKNEMSNGDQNQQNGSAPQKPCNFPLIFAIVGAVLGIPISKFFQAEIFRKLASMGDYIKELPKLLKYCFKDLANGDSLRFLFTLILTMAALGVAGWFAGKKVSESQKGGSNQNGQGC